MKTLHNIPSIKIYPAKPVNHSWAKNWTEQLHFLKNNPEIISLYGANDFCYYLNTITP
jgi:hypothetical protein